jgi:hypothetical protein
MRKAIGALLVGIGALFLIGSMFSLLYLLPAIPAALSTGGEYYWGRVVGGVLGASLFFLVGCKAFKAGRVRFHES